MSRISNDLAGQIAFKLTEKSRIVAENLHVDYRELVTSFYEEQTPKEVKDCLKKFPDWVDTTTSVKLHGHGFNWEYVSTTRAVIQNNTNEGMPNMTSKMADKISTAKRKWLKAKEKYETLKTESKQALLTLKTFSNIRKELPEASPMLPPPMSNALVVNFNSLKTRLNNQPDVKEKEVAEIDE